MSSPRCTGGGVGPVPEPADRRAPGGDGDVAPPQLAEQLGVQPGQVGVDEDRVALQGDHAVVRQLAGAGQQPLAERLGEVGPGRAGQPGARLGRGQRLGGIDAAVDGRQDPGRGGRVPADGSKAAPTPAASASEVDRAQRRVGRLQRAERGEHLGQIRVVGGFGELVPQPGQAPAQERPAPPAGCVPARPRWRRRRRACASAGPHGTAWPAWAACRIAVTIWVATGRTAVSVPAASSVAAASSAVVLTWPAWMAWARAVSRARIPASSSGTPSMLAGGGGGGRLAEVTSAAGAGGGGGQRGPGRPGADHPAGGGRERAPGDRPVVRGGQVAHGAVAGDEPVQRRAEQPQPRGRVGGHPALPQRPGRGQPQRQVAHPLPGLAQRAQAGQHVGDEILLRADADLQPEPGDAPVPRVEVEVASPLAADRARWWPRPRRSGGA